MSEALNYKTILAIRNCENLSANCKLVLVMLATRGDECYPSQQTIAYDTSLSLSTVKKTLGVLEEAGLVVVKRTGRASTYSLKPILGTGDLIVAGRLADSPSLATKEKEKDTKKDLPAAGELQRQVIGRFVEHYKQVSGVDPIIGPKEFAAAKRLYSQLPLDEAVAVIDAAFADPWFRDKCRDLSFIASKINTYRQPIRPQHKVYDPKEDKPVEDAVPMPGSILEFLNEESDKRR